MPNYYNEQTKFYVSVDCAIFGYSDGILKLLIHKRPYEPGKGDLSLIGGFVEKDESILQVTVISDGEIANSSLKICGLGTNWLYETLKSENVALKDVFLMTADKYKNYTIIKKEG